MTDEIFKRLRSGPPRFHGDEGHFEDERFARAHVAMEQALEAWDEPLGVPGWADGHVRVWRDRLGELVSLVHAAGHALHLMPAMPMVLEAIHAALEPDSDDEVRHRDSEMRDVLESAARAVELGRSNYRLLFVLGTVWLWTSLEALVEDLVVQALANSPASELAPRLKGLKVPGEMLLIRDPDELARALYREWETRNAGAEGATLFEAILALGGLDGEVPTDVRRDVFELGHVRNVLLHRGGVVDAAFVKSCPWTGAVPSVEVEVGHHKFEEYAFAVTHYVAIIRERIVDRYGRPVLP